MTLAGLLAFVLALSPLVLAVPVEPTIQWRPCRPPSKGPPSRLKYDCGNLDVPLDYTRPESKERVGLQLLRARATKKPSMGTILYNPGGPGVSSREKLPEDAALLLWMSGEHYDLVAFDPRGTGNTMPFSCGPLVAKQTPDDDLETIWRASGATAEQCSAKNDGSPAAELMGTAFAARDAMRIVDALGGDGLLRFWGFSYGTVLGATAAAMFPDRIDRMVLDGVVNPQEWYSGQSDESTAADTDRVLLEVFRTCVAIGPQQCRLARRASTASTLRDLAWARFEDLKRRPVTVMRDPRLDVHYPQLAQLASNAILNRNRWLALLDFLDDLLDVPGSEAYEASTRERRWAAPAPALRKGDAMLAAHMAVRCGDKAARAAAFDEFEPFMQAASNSSRLAGLRVASMSAVCAQWGYHAKEAHTGDFRAKTKAPVLVLSTEFDPRTPLASARNISSSLEGSEVIVVEGAGHCTASLPSSCTAQHLQNYWKSGTMPGAGTRCEATPFGKRWVDVLRDWKSNSHHKRGLDDMMAESKIADWLEDGLGEMLTGREGVLDFLVNSEIQGPDLF